MKLSALVVISLVCGGCESHRRDVIAVEPNDLGITELEVRHERVQDDQVLTLRGFDEAGATIATTVLRTGMVMYGADMPEQLSAGTELTVTIGERNTSFVSPDRVPHVIYEPLSPSVGTFVRLHRVASEIDREAGIRFAPPSQLPGPSDEIAFTAGACSGSRFPTAKGGANQCCQDNANTYHVNPTTLAIANRSTYAPVYPSIPVCRDSAGNTGCTTNCMYGPCGSAVISTKGTNGHVFVPTSNPNVCGWDDGGPGGLGVDYSPEHYTTQSLWGGVTATCLCTGCNADGTAQCGFFDDFNRTSGLGSNWAIRTGTNFGTFSTDGNYAVSSGITGGQTSPGAWARLIPTFGTYDYSVQSKITVPAGGFFTGVAARCADPTNVEQTFYSAQLTTDTGGYVTLYRRNAGTWTFLGAGGPPVTPGVPYTLKLVATGSNPVHLEVWVNGSIRLSYDDSSASRITTGGAALETWDNNAKYDDFQVDPVTAGGGGGGLPFVDDMNRSGGLGANWIVTFGDFILDGARAVSQAVPGGYNGPGNLAQVIPNLATNDYAITSRLSLPAGAIAAGVVARITPGGGTHPDTYLALLYNSYPDWYNNVILYRRNSPGGVITQTQLGFANVTITSDTMYNLKLVATGSNPVHLEVWLDGVQKITYDDSSASRLPTGKVGMLNWNANVKYDSFRVDPP